MQISGASLFEFLRPSDARHLLNETHPVVLPERGRCRRHRDVQSPTVGFSASRSIFARGEGAEVRFGGHRNLAEGNPR